MSRGLANALTAAQPSPTTKICSERARPGGRSRPETQHLGLSDTPQRLDFGAASPPAPRASPLAYKLLLTRRLPLLRAGRRRPRFRLWVSRSASFGFGAPGWSNQYCASRSGFIFGPHSRLHFGALQARHDRVLLLGQVVERLLRGFLAAGRRGDVAPPQLRQAWVVRHVGAGRGPLTRAGLR